MRALSCNENNFSLEFRHRDAPARDHSHDEKGPAMTPEEADALFDRHCAAEAARDLPGIMATLAEGAEHEVVGDPDSVLTDPSAIEKRYQTMFGSRSVWCTSAKRATA
jgi:hypothetical protein